MQTQGSSGAAILKERVKAYGIGTLWYGSIATALASFVGSFPWFATVSFFASSPCLPTSSVLMFPSLFLIVQLARRGSPSFPQHGPKAFPPSGDWFLCFRRFRHHLQLVE